MSTNDLFVEDSGDETSLSASNSNSVAKELASIIIDETESEDESLASLPAANRSIRSPDAVDSDDERLAQRIKKRQSMRMSLHYPREIESSSSSEEDDRASAVNSDSLPEDEEDLSTENRTLSPITRMSITGRQAEITSDEEDDNDSIMPLQKGKRKVKKFIISDDEEDDDPAQTHGESDSEKQSANSFDSSLPMRSFDAEGRRDSISTKLSSTLNSEGGDTNGNSVEQRENSSSELSATEGNVSGVRELIAPKLSSTLLEPKTEVEGRYSALNGNAKLETETSSPNNRHSISVRGSIGNKMSSTLLEVTAAKEASQVSIEMLNESSSLKLIEKSAEILSVSSEDEQVTKENRPLVQPTLNKFVKEHVSQSDYDAKIRRMADLKGQLVALENLMKNRNKLPDQGVALMKRMQEIKQQIFEIARAVEIIQPTPRKGIKQDIRRSFNSSTQSATNDSNQNGVMQVSWDDIKRGADEMQPKYTGKQGIATFENQKLLTMDRLATLHKSIETCPTEDTLAEPPKLLKIELMDHQRHALAWMMWRENQKPRGGILADDMGLGKTLSMISLILKTTELDPEGNNLPDSDESDTEENNAGGWKSKGRRDMYAGGTLIICPASLIRQWEGEINNRVKRNSLAVKVHHGNQRDSKPRHLAKFDVIITTYNIVSRELNDAPAGIFGVNWERIILDEAHVIRNHKSAMSMACCKLKGRYRWILTGTPIQNKEMDMYALMKFLRCTPFDDLVHWKKWIDNKTAGGTARLNTIMKSVMLRRTKQQLQDRGSLKDLPDKTITQIEVTLETEEMNVYQKVLLYSKTLFSQFLHQRTEKSNAIMYGYQSSRPTFKQTHNPNEAFDRVHQKLKRMHANGEGNVAVQQHQILVLLLRLRQICCHPGLIHQMLSDDDGNFDLEPDVENAAELDLLAQLNKLKLSDPTSTEENSSKTDRSLNLSDEMTEQQQAIVKASQKVMLKSNPVFCMDRLSSKISAVLELLQEKVQNNDDKAIVVSQWTSMLEILATHLSRKRISYVALNGKVPVKFRNDIVLDFNKAGSGAKIMLLSLTAGGVGLNLVGANHLLLLDPHWNPQLEAQAQDRIYRVGQTKPVFIYKFMCMDTVEQKIFALQQHKLGIANGVLTGTKNTGSKLTIDDLKSLFGL